MATLTAGIIHARNPPEEGSTAVRVGVADGQSPATPQVASETAAAQGAISLAELVKEIRSRPTTSTTRPRVTTTTTTIRKSAATPTSTPATTTTTAKPAPAPSPSTTSTTVSPGSPLTTLLEKVVPPAAAVTGVLTRSDSGVASWFRAPDATCAHRTLAMGTLIKVTRLANGASATCKVNDRGPTAETGRLIDLSLDTFEKLAGRDAGLIDVKIEW